MSDEGIERARAEVAEASRGLAAAGLVRGTGGNVSARCGDGLFAITPTGAVLAELSAGDVSVVDASGALVAGELAPTSEIELHLGVYEAHGAGAVVHTHAPVATALSTVIEELPCVHYEMLLLGGPVRVAPYETFGTPELARSAVDALEGRTAAILANHGTIAFGGDLPGAVKATELLEWSAELYWRAAQIGEPKALDEAARQAVIDAAVKRGYGSVQKVEEVEEEQG